MLDPILFCLFLGIINDSASTCLFYNSFIHAFIHLFNKSLLRTYCVLGTCCYQGWSELDPVPVRGAYFSEKDVNQRIVMTECKIVPRTSVAKEKGGGCFGSWDTGGGLWAWDLKVGEGVRSRWCAQSREHRVREAVWGQDQRSMAGLGGIILLGAVAGQIWSWKGALQLLRRTSLEVLTPKNS